MDNEFSKVKVNEAEIEELVEEDHSIDNASRLTLNSHQVALDDYHASNHYWNNENIHRPHSTEYENYQHNLNIKPSDTATNEDINNETIIFNDYSFDLIDNIENNTGNYSPKSVNTLPPMPHQRMINVREVIRNGNLNELEEIVLQGYGERLLAVNNNTAAPLVQEFLDNLPNYLVCNH